VYEDIGFNEEYSATMRDAYDASWAAYEYLLEAGVAKEQARAVLPVGIYSQMIWTCNPRSLMHFLGLRAAPTALKEIRVLAQQAEEVFSSLMPATHIAFVSAGRVAP
jgi:thymidylate synthase (FAD)